MTTKLEILLIFGLNKLKLYNMDKPDVLLKRVSIFKKIMSHDYRITWTNNYSKDAQEDAQSALWTKRKTKIERINLKIENAFWANLSTYFKYPEAVRTLIYTTNTIEGFNRQLRKVTKSKSVFPTDDSLLKMLYLAMIDITKKWTGKRKDWGQIHFQLEIFFADRLPQ